MVCKNCGKKQSGIRCCLCGRNAYAPLTPWGKTKKICSYCKEKQVALMQERLTMNERTKTLLQGKDYVVKKKDTKLVKK